jgi:D-alanyl-D-alanine carboxypeptidase
MSGIGHFGGMRPSGPRFVACSRSRPTWNTISPVIRRLLLALAALLCATTVLASPAAGRSAQTDPEGEGGPATATGNLPLPRASILVDIDTGKVLVNNNAHEALGVASTIKIMSALVIGDHVEDGDPVPISPLAEGMPARKINVKAGQTWPAAGLLQAMLLCSCNDAAVALAEAASGSLEKFSLAMADEAERLGMVDAPVLNDPSGLDDEFSFRGGNRISAYDLAIAARAFLTREDLAAIVALPEASFPGGDGVEHRVVNHNRLMKQYPGAIGMKTGYTERSGHSLIGAARRDGRTLVAIVIDSPNTYQQVTELLDIGFAIPVKDQSGTEKLPKADREGRAVVDPPTTVARAGSGGSDGGRVAGVSGATTDGGSSLGSRLPYVVLVAGLALAVAVRRRQVVVRRRRLAAERRRAMQRADREFARAGWGRAAG